MFGTILQIITICITLLSLFLGLANTIRENKKEHYLELITRQRLENKKNLQQAFIAIFTHVNEASLSIFNEEKLVVCSQACSQIHCILKEIYAQEKELLAECDLLLRELAFYLQTKKNTAEILLITRKLYNLYSVYDLSDWRFIKCQSTGKHMDSENYDQIYEETYAEYFKKKVG